MKHHVTLYTPTPDHSDRFLRMWARYHAAPASRVGAALTIILGALAGAAIAWGMGL
jgi:hypothetical protein